MIIEKIDGFEIGPYKDGFYCFKLNSGGLYFTNSGELKNFDIDQQNDFVIKSRNKAKGFITNMNLPAIEVPVGEYNAHLIDKLVCMGYDVPNIWTPNKNILYLKNNTVHYSSKHEDRNLLSYSDFIKEAKKGSCRQLKLNNEYTAKISSEGVLVGCTVFNLETAVELGEIAKKYL